MIFIDYKDRRPVYEQIVERYQELVVSGILQPDTALPSVRSQAMELSINPNTIQRAYAEMERRGIIYSVKGRGSFIAPTEAIVEKRKQEILQEMAELATEARKLKIKEDVVTATITDAYARTDGTTEAGREMIEEAAGAVTNTGTGGEQHAGSKESDEIL